MPLCSVCLEVCPSMPEGGIYEMWCEMMLEINPDSEIQNKDNTSSERTKVRQ